jgi:hypothetical protein
MKLAPILIPRSGDMPASGLPTGSESRSDDKMVGGPYWEGGPLQGDDYPLEYYEDGYRKAHGPD